jgi:hypothetical protein
MPVSPARVNWLFLKRATRKRCDGKTTTRRKLPQFGTLEIIENFNIFQYLKPRKAYSAIALLL